MNILVSINKNDSKCKIFNKNLVDYTVKNLEGQHKLYIYSDVEEIQERFKSRIIEAKSEIDALVKFSKDKKTYMFINRLALCNINMENLIKYHTNHDKEITVVSKNFVKDKSIPIYKLNDKKDIMSVTRKRFADCGIYLFKNNDIDFSKYKNMYSIILDAIKNSKIKGFVHKGYWWTSSNIRRRNNGKSFNAR